MSGFFSWDEVDAAVVVFPPDKVRPYLLRVSTGLGSLDGRLYVVKLGLDSLAFVLFSVIDGLGSRDFSRPFDRRYEDNDRYLLSTGLESRDPRE